MSTTPAMLRQWFKEGKSEGATHMIVVCDTFSHDDYPVYVLHGQSSREVAVQYDGKDMQRIMECYDLNMDMEAQLAEGRVFNW